MRVLLLASAFNSLTQRVHTELRDEGHTVSVELARGDNDSLREAITRFRPDVILAPMLTRVVPEDVWARHPVLIVHPGPMGDRGPSSLDWAILEGHRRWGVTVLQAIEEMDAGPIWASVEFDVAAVGKSDLYRTEVADAAIAAVRLALARFATSDDTPEPLDYDNPAVWGELRPMMAQDDRRVDWNTDDTATVLRKLRCADSQPGVLDEFYGAQHFVHGGHTEDVLRGDAGAVLATRDGAICVGTTDGAVWVLQLRPVKAPDGPATFKRPAATVLADALTGIPEVSVTPVDAARRETWSELRYHEQERVGWLEWSVAAGAMSTEQCQRLLAAYRDACARPTDILILGPKRDFFSNGIHLNVIEGATDPAFESWCNIVAIDDVVEALLTTTDKYTIAALPGNAAAGGVMMALAADEVWCRDAAVLNPHYRLMGLYGSEFWTYTLPRRVGEETAQELMDAALPINARQGLDLGLVDRVLPGSIADFERNVWAGAHRLETSTDLTTRLQDKKTRRYDDERTKPLIAYRAAELEQMHDNFFHPEASYGQLRTGFVRKDKAAPVASTALTTLRAIRLLVPLPAHILERMAARVVPLDVHEGSAVVTQGERADHVYFVQDGRYDVHVDGQFVRALGPGDTFGEVGVLSEGVRMATVIATRDGSVLALAADAFRSALSGDPLVSSDAHELAAARRRGPSG